MSLLSLDILEGKTSKYETNHIHMIVDGEILKWTPKFGQKNFGVYFMRKKHDYSALLKYMHMLEDSYSFNYIHTTND